MFDFINNFTASVNVPALTLFLVLVCVHYMTIPFWIKALVSDTKGLFLNGNTNRKQMVTRCIYVAALFIAIGVVPYALLWGFTNFTTMMVASVIVFVVDQAVTRTMIARGTLGTVFAAN